MDKIKISSLGIFDEQRFKKLADDRNDWLNSGNDMLISSNYKVNEIADELKPSQLVVSIKKINKEGLNYKSIVLENVSGSSLPNFKAGQKVAVTISIQERYYTKPYTIISSPSVSADGEYTILVKEAFENIVDNYLYNEAKENDKVVVSAPFGDFYFETLRDQKNVIAIVSDEGILPIYSMVQAIIDKTENFNLTIFYSVKNETDIIFKEELLEYANKSNKIKINFVLSEEEKEGFLTGFVSSDKIKPYYEVGNTSIFISGNEGLLKYLDKELEYFKLPKKFVKYEAFFPKCGIKRVVRYNLSIYVNDEKYEIPCYNNKTIMQALAEGGIYIPSKCHNGSCGLCRSELVLGEVKIINDKRSASDKKFNYIHPCSTYPLSDISIVVR